MSFRKEYDNGVSVTITRTPGIYVQNARVMLGSAALPKVHNILYI